ncbi:hypothetical protein [Mycobacterium syngnathidarum]
MQGLAPVPPGVLVGDLTRGSVLTVIGVLAALHGRNVPGRARGEPDRRLASFDMTPEMTTEPTKSSGSSSPAI